MGPFSHTLSYEVMPMKPPIQAESFLRRGEQPVSARDLDQARRTQLALWLKMTYLNELYQGKATFSPKKKTG